MSMDYSASVGSGLLIYKRPSEHKLANFILAHSKALSKLDNDEAIRALHYIHVCIQDSKPIELYKEFSDYEDYQSCYTGALGLVSDIMREETGISFVYYGTTDQTNTEQIILECLPPWLYTDKEKKILSSDDMRKICEPYIEELNEKIESYPKDSIVFDDWINVIFFG